MHNDTTNLLPPERRRALSRAFFLRIVVVAVVLVTVLTLAAGVLLVPTYVLLGASADAKRAHLATMEASVSSSNEAQLSARLAALSISAAKLTALSKNHSASALIQAALLVPRPGITLTGFSYAPAAGASSPATLVISGSSATRDALRNYQLALQGASFALSATLPVSAYASDSDISFAITVTLAP